MSQYTTNDCKEFLYDEFPYDEKGWKRVGKRKDQFGNVVREFTHPDISKNIFIVESSDGLKLTTGPFNQGFDPTFFIFSVMDDEMSFLPSLGGHSVLICLDHPDYPDSSGSGEYDHVIPGLLPPSWKVEQECEESFSVYNSGLSEEDFVVAMHDMGFRSSAVLDQQCNGRSALNSPIILARGKSGAK